MQETTDASKHVFKLDEEVIEYVKEYKYLGVLFDQYLTMTAAVNQLSKAGSHALGQILGKTKCNYDLGYVSYSKLFHSCVVPVLDYGSGVWSQGRDCSKIDQIQSQACRYYCGLPKGAPLVGVAAEMGWVPGIVRRDAETLRLYNQLDNLPVSRLNRKVFVYEHELCLDGSWSANIKSLCASMEMLDNWKNLRPVPLKIVQEKLNNMYESELLSAIGGKPKLQTYKHLKDNIGVENYLKANVAKHKRSLICQLRLGILPLALETGRYQKNMIKKVIAFGFLPLNFGRRQGPMKGTVNAGSVVGYSEGHSNPTLCRRISLNLFALTCSGDTKTSGPSARARTT